MLSLRRPQYEMRIEIMPLIDVIFLLLTFFIYAMVLMVRAELLPVQMHAFSSGEAARVPPAVAITIDRDGAIYFNREQISIDRVLERLEAVKAANAARVDTPTAAALLDGDGDGAAAAGAAGAAVTMVAPLDSIVDTVTVKPCPPRADCSSAAVRKVALSTTVLAAVAAAAEANVRLEVTSMSMAARRRFSDRRRALSAVEQK